ncbi:MAG: tetratricopeptide repeat protein [Salinibacter sp.]
MTIRRSALFSLFVGGLLLAALSGCSGGNPYMSTAEDAMEQQNYDRALANIDSALAQDSANVDAYLMRAQILRQRADSTMPPDKYKSLYRRAREAEEMAIKFDPGARSDVEGQRRLTYAQQSQRGAKAFRRGRRTSDSMAYRQAAAHFGAASATYPDSASVILNEAYARLNMAQSKQAGSMAGAIPILERYVETAEEPQKNAYDILSALYLQEGQTQKAIDLLETARQDLSQRPTHFRVGGSRGLKYSGTIETNGSSRSVSGTTPDRIPLDNASGTVRGTFEKAQEKGQLRVQLFYRGTAVTDTTVSTGSATLSANLSQEAPLAQIEGRLLNAYNQAGETKKAMAEYREQIEENPENVTYRYNYGSMLLQAGRLDDAIEQLQRAVELEPGNVKAQYNLGAAYSNKARRIQDSIQTLNDSLRSISQQAVDENREPTAEEKRMVNKLDKQLKALEERKQKLFRKAIPPLERARQMAGNDSSFRQDACSALVTAYVQIEQVQKAQKYEKCAGMQIQQGGSGSGGGGSGS